MRPTLAGSNATAPSTRCTAFTTVAMSMEFGVQLRAELEAELRPYGHYIAMRDVEEGTQPLTGGVRDADDRNLQLAGFVDHRLQLARLGQDPIGLQAVIALRAVRLRAAASLAEAPGGNSGFMLLPSGEMAFDARLALAEAATRSIDVQYYHIHADTAG